MFALTRKSKFDEALDKILRLNSVPPDERPADRSWSGENPNDMMQRVNPQPEQNPPRWMNEKHAGLSSVVGSGLSPEELAAANSTPPGTAARNSADHPLFLGNWKQTDRAPSAPEILPHPSSEEKPMLDGSHKKAPNLTTRAGVEAEISRRENKDWTRPQNMGGDGDNDRNWWDVIKNIGLGMLTAGGDAYNRSGGRADLQTIFGSMIGGGAAQGVMGAIDPNTDEKFFNNMKLAELDQKRGAMLAKEQQELALAGEKLKQENIVVDNERQQQMIDDRRTQKELDREQKVIDANNKRVEQIRKRKHFDHTKISEADRRTLMMAELNPEDLGSWDDRNPVEKKVAGVHYRLNRTTGDYEPTNLEDPSEKLVDYPVIMPNGEKRVYKVPAAKAAGFAVQMEFLNARFAENERSRDFQAEQNRRKLAVTEARTKTDVAKVVQTLRMHEGKPKNNLGDEVWTKEEIEEKIKQYLSQVPAHLR